MNHGIYVNHIFSLGSERQQFIQKLLVVHFLLVGLLFKIYTEIMTKKSEDAKQFYGTVTLGQKGQVVIPMEARKAMGVTKGDKLLVFGMGCDMLAFSKLSELEQFASHLSGRLDAIRSIIKRSE